MIRGELENILNPTPFKAANNNNMRFASNLLATSIAVPLTAETHPESNQWDQNIHEIFEPHSIPFEIQPFINSIVLLFSSVNDDLYYQAYGNDAPLQATVQDGISSVDAFFSFDSDFISNLFIDNSSDYDALNNNYYIPVNDDELAAFIPIAVEQDADVIMHDGGDTYFTLN